MNPHEILEAIERKSLKRGVSMAELCRITGISYSTYWRWKKGAGMQTHKLMNLQKAVDELPK